MISSALNLISSSTCRLFVISKLLVLRNGYDVGRIKDRDGSKSLKIKMSYVAGLDGRCRHLSFGYRKFLADFDVSIKILGIFSLGRCHS